MEYHIRCRKGDVAKCVLLPGDPGRAEWIAENFFDEYRTVAKNREFWTFTGKYKDMEISVTSTGIGSPSAAIAIEELIRVGAKCFIRVGTSGSLQPFINLGDIIIATGAVRDEGTTHQYVPPEYPAVASFKLLTYLSKAAEESNARYHIGIVHSKDAFYSEYEEEVPKADITARWKTWEKANVLATEMESAALMVVGSIRKVHVGTVLTIIGSTHTGEPVSSEKISLEPMIRIALEAGHAFLSDEK